MIELLVTCGCFALLAFGILCVAATAFLILPAPHTTKIVVTPPPKQRDHNDGPFTGDEWKNT